MCLFRVVNITHNEKSIYYLFRRHSILWKGKVSDTMGVFLQKLLCVLSLRRIYAAMKYLLIISTFLVCYNHYTQPVYRPEYEHYLKYKDKVVGDLPKEELILFQITNKKKLRQYLKVRPKQFSPEQKRILNKFRLFSYEDQLITNFER